MSNSELRHQSSGSSGRSSNQFHRAHSRTSSADSIFEDISTRAHNLFGLLDEDKKGYLDTRILAQACGKRLNERQLGELIQHLDHDGDGRVSKEDFKQCLREIARRNSMIRGSIMQVPSVITTHKSTTTSTSPDSTRSRKQSDEGSSETEDRVDGHLHGSRSAVFIRPTSKPHEKTRERLLRRMVAGATPRSSGYGITRQFSSSLPELAAIDECLGSLNCERTQHSADILRLSEELDQQIQLAEQAARARERELALTEFRGQLEAKSAQVEQLLERLRQVEEQNLTMEHDGSKKSVQMDDRLNALQAEIAQLRLERTSLEDMLTATRAELVQTRTELTTLKQSFIEKSRELESHIATYVDVVKENSNLSSQLTLLQEVNRELCDANDCLCAVLERSTEDVESTASLKDAATAYSLLYSNFKQLLVEKHIVGAGTPKERSKSNYLVKHQTYVRCKHRHTDNMSEGACISNKCLATSTALMDDKLRIFRVMLAGDSAVGKTSLLVRLCDNMFTGKAVSTIGIDMKMRSITVDDRTAMLQIWDTAGQERFRSISANFYRKADGILLVYDCTQESSFLNIREWMSTVQENAGREIPVAIVGNKVDLRDQQELRGAHCVTYVEGRKFAQEIGALFFETSALTGENVEECATELTRTDQCFGDTDAQTPTAFVVPLRAKATFLPQKAVWIALSLGHQNVCNCASKQIYLRRRLSDFEVFRVGIEVGRTEAAADCDAQFPSPESARDIANHGGNVMTSLLGELGSCTVKAIALMHSATNCD
ncbi:Ras and EF-hand domain-containing protein homolog [Clonorchis sinensis]|uniref:Ras and EF-hand domain-containing protein homolog n=1 Tax=Clonorchis sinensis TaxID=79923 RepID=G7YBL3_CLOSI|nr:Ras and EF-hand domain-containing protein homolog [Clonorchis sinensis]